MPLVHVQNLHKTFGIKKAVDGISFALERGEVLGFLGPNGAGKSTTMKMIAGFLTADSGKVTLADVDVFATPVVARQHLGYLPEGAPLYGDMTVRAFLAFAAAMRGMSASAAASATARVVGQLQLEEVLTERVEVLSKGFKRRVGLAQTLLHDPEILVLDEPTDGLDPNQKHHIRGLIKEMAASKAIIISTHILEEVDALCTRAMIINRGQTVLDKPVADLSRDSQGRLDTLFRETTAGVFH
jgi:ABC-2 type transport system ATP-binding protein